MALPLEGVRILDLTWLNAGAKGTRHLSTYGAELIHLEWKGKLDVLRWATPFHAVPGDENNHAKSPNRAASFNTNHVGKWGVSLNMRHPKGKDIFRRLVEKADVVVDNFTASTLADWGFGWEVLQSIKPDIIYLQAPGFGRIGAYADYRSYGPTAAAIGGLTWQAGLADRPPSGFGFSYMDVVGPYFIAMGVMAALRQRNRTGKGVYVDASQVGPSFLLTGSSIPEWSATGRRYVRTGNRSPYIKAAPHGAYRCAADEEKWIAIACYDEAQWKALVTVMGNPAWASEARFATLDARLQNQDVLDANVGAWTLGKDRYALMAALQQVGVAAGVCQDVSDRYDRDPQLRHRNYFVRVRHSEVPPYDVESLPGVFSETPPSPLGTTGWGCHTYGEHNEQVLGRLLGLTRDDIEALAREDVI